VGLEHRPALEGIVSFSEWQSHDGVGSAGEDRTLYIYDKAGGWLHRFAVT
jgi:hypothetical protein